MAKVTGKNSWHLTQPIDYSIYLPVVSVRNCAAHFPGNPVYMCYEFVHSCDVPLIDQFNSLAGAGNYFMFCIRQLNYVCCNDAAAIDRMKGLLFLNGLVLHSISEKELVHTVDFAGTKEFQSFHGSKLQYNEFRKIYGAPALD